MPRSADLIELLERPVLEVAPRLLGAVLRLGDVAVRLTEVEAYGGANDAGSHAFAGRTARNSVMFDRAGHLYTYFIYGMHTCANVVTGPEGRASAVLLRAGEVVAGAGSARERRGSCSHRDLARGPARLCQALGLLLTDNGMDLLRPSATVTLDLASAPVEASKVSTGPRVGLSRAADLPWRFWITGEPTVSVYRSGSPPRPKPGTPATG